MFEFFGEGIAVFIFYFFINFFVRKGTRFESFVNEYAFKYYEKDGGVQ